MNKLATNAIKHASEKDKSGPIRVTITKRRGEAIVLVDDDGASFLDPGGLALEWGSPDALASIGGLFIAPTPGSKPFELRVPAAQLPRPTNGSVAW